MVALDPETIFYTTHIVRTARVGLVMGVDSSYYRPAGSEAIYIPWEGDAEAMGFVPQGDKVDRVMVLWTSDNATSYEPADCLIKIAKVKKST